MDHPTDGDDRRRDRPETDARYGILTDTEGLLPWSHVDTRLRESRTFWASTTLPDGRPHARPVWGVVVDGRVHCGGGEGTRWVRNLARDPSILLHAESGTDVVIVEGRAERLDADADPGRLARIDDAYEAKYDIRHGTPVFAVHPRRVLAWTDYPADATRWLFDPK